MPYQANFSGNALFSKITYTALFTAKIILATTIQIWNDLPVGSKNQAKGAYYGQA